MAHLAGYLSITATFSGPKGDHYRQVPLYIQKMMLCTYPLHKPNATTVKPLIKEEDKPLNKGQPKNNLQKRTTSLQDKMLGPKPLFRGLTVHHHLNQ